VTEVTPVSGATWLAEFQASARAGKREQALSSLELRKTAHAGTPPSAEKLAAVRALLAVDAGGVRGWALWFAGQAGPTAKEMAALLLLHSYREHPEEAAGILRSLADDENWEVREWAGSSAGEILARHFDEVYPVVEAWLDDPSQFVRRAVAIAAKGAADRQRPERAEPLLRLMDRLVTDRAEEVRRNTGPFAVGGNLLRRYPEQTLERVRRWSVEEDEMSRWNAAMVFSSAEARSHVDVGLEVLSDLARDERKLVWMAVASALRNLVKRAPDRVVPELRTWLADERKLPAALALKKAQG
jgi:3-methyladenine DNA glycosylase AlkC